MSGISKYIKWLLPQRFKNEWFLVKTVQGEIAGKIKVLKLDVCKKNNCFIVNKYIYVSFDNYKEMQRNADKYPELV